MLAIFVTIQVKPGFVDQLAEASLDDALGSVRDEPGCFRFDVLHDATDPNRLHLYEVYADNAAFEAHGKTPHFLKWRATVSDWFDGEPVVIRCSTTFPSDERWRAQKPNLVE